MNAITLLAPNRIEVANVPEPEPGPGVLVRSTHVGICGTDIKILKGTVPVDYPRIMGHEMVGEVVAAPSSSHLLPGERVLVDPGVACGICDLCRAGRFNICRNGGLMGRDIDGVFTELVEVPLSRLVRIPGAISTRSAGLLQVLGTCVHAVKATRPFPGQVALVIGLGVSGQLISQLLTLQGLTVVGTTRSKWKRDLAETSGIAAAVPPEELDATLAGIGDGLGPHLVVEAVGQEGTLASAIELVRVGGEILVFGTITSGSAGLPYYHLYHKELTVRNPRAALIGDYADGVALAASGALHLEQMVTHELTLDEAGRAFELVDDPASLKVMMSVHPNRG
jgi:2-desacetyl-2-hydroxyethyl bacteriochlorophyllide A dehydrogenase